MADTRRKGMASQRPAPVTGSEIASGDGQAHAYVFRRAQSLRAKAMEWSPWQAAPARVPDVDPIMLTVSNPDSDSQPIDELLACNERVLRSQGVSALMYGGSQGYPGLRDWLAHDANRRERLALTADNFVLTCGASGALENLCEALLDPGDVVFVERPTFPGSTSIIVSCLAEVVGISMDSDGLNPDDLERAIARVRSEGKRPKLLYTIANYHNPVTTTLTLERRERISRVCRNERILIAQDDAYGLLGFGGEAPQSFFALSGGDGAVLLGTFSKTLATRLRIGWLMGDRSVVDAVTRMRFDMGVSPWSSHVISEFCESGRFDEHVPRVIGIYRRKRDVMLGALAERCGKFARWSLPEGALFVWVELSESVDPDRLYDAAREEGVGYFGGRAFYDAGTGGSDGARYIRLTYSHASEVEISEAILRLGRAMERAAS